MDDGTTDRIVEEEGTVTVETAYGTATLELPKGPEQDGPRLEGRRWDCVGRDEKKRLLARRVSRFLAAWAETE